MRRKLASAISAARKWQHSSAFYRTMVYAMIAKVTQLKLEGIDDRSVSLAGEMLDRYKAEAAAQRKEKRAHVVPTNTAEHTEVIMARIAAELTEARKAVV